MLKQPALGGFNMKVTSTVTYTLQDAATDTAVWEKTVEHAYTAKLGDPLYGVERLKLATNEGSIKGNIQELVEALKAWDDRQASAANEEQPGTRSERERERERE